VKRPFKCLIHLSIENTKNLTIINAFIQTSYFIDWSIDGGVDCLQSRNHKKIKKNLNSLIHKKKVSIYYPKSIKIELRVFQGIKPWNCDGYIYCASCYNYPRTWGVNVTGGCLGFNVFKPLYDQFKNTKKIREVGKRISFQICYNLLKSVEQKRSYPYKSKKCYIYPQAPLITRI